MHVHHDESHFVRGVIGYTLVRLLDMRNNFDVVVDCLEYTQCPETMVFSDCGSCTASCDNLRPVCPRVCSSGCFCPDSAPVLLDNGRCGTWQQCIGTASDFFCM